MRVQGAGCSGGGQVEAVFLGIQNAGLAQLAEEGAPTAGGLQVVQVEVGWAQPAGHVGEAFMGVGRPQLHHGQVAGGG